MHKTVLFNSLVKENSLKGIQYILINYLDEVSND